MAEFTSELYYCLYIHLCVLNVVFFILKIYNKTFKRFIWTSKKKKNDEITLKNRPGGFHGVSPYKIKKKSDRVDEVKPCMKFQILYNLKNETVKEFDLGQSSHLGYLNFQRNFCIKWKL